MSEDNESTELSTLHGVSVGIGPEGFAKADKVAITELVQAQAQAVLGNVRIIERQQAMEETRLSNDHIQVMRRMEMAEKVARANQGMAMLFLGALLFIFVGVMAFAIITERYQIVENSLLVIISFIGGTGTGYGWRKRKEG